MTVPISAEEKRQLAEELGPWHYVHDLGDGILTRTGEGSDQEWHEFRKELLLGTTKRVFNGSLEGKTCLDVACNSGFWSYEFAKLGARHVLGVERSSLYFAQAEFLKKCRAEWPESSRIDFEHRDVFSLEEDERRFDFISAFGIAYHTTDPTRLFRILRKLCRNCLLVDTSVSTLEVDEPVLELSNADKYVCCGEKEFSWIPTEKALVAILEHAGFVKVSKIMPPRPTPLRVYYAAFVQK